MASGTTANQPRRVNIEHEFYDPLLPGQIRLLRAVSIENLSFEFVPALLDKCPKYGCLSYVWGDSTLCEQITLQGKPFWVTKSLFIALDRFRRGIGRKKLRPLKKLFWIDAACINQGCSDVALTERSDQVQRMTEIYGGAEMVYVWLGPAKDERRNSLAAAKLAKLEATHLRYQIRSLNSNLVPSAHLARLATIERRLGMAEADEWSRTASQTPDAWIGIIEMWKSEWWKRAWAHQEGTVPASHSTFFRRYQILWPPTQLESKVSFVSGNEQTTWASMSFALVCTPYIIANTATGADILNGTARAFYRLYNIQQLREKTMKNMDPSNIKQMIKEKYVIDKKSLMADAPSLDPLDMFNRFRLAECRDPRDKVFAALGLLPSLRSRINVDYRRSTLETYVEVIRTILSTPNASLDFLGYASKSNPWLQIMSVKQPDVRWDQFPTWVPNWFCPIDLTPFPKVLYLQGGRHTHDKYRMNRSNVGSSSSAYSACGRECNPKAVIDGTSLRSRGWCLDDISEILPDGLSEDQKRATYTRWWNLSRSVYPDVEMFNRDLRRVHCADVKLGALPSRKPVARGYEIVDALLSADKAELNESQLAEQANMSEALRQMTTNRAIGMTRKRRLCLVPYGTKVGDEVVALFGGQVLYVLRPRGGSENRHEYVGEAYVHGLMDGEVTGMADRGEVRAQVFTLD